MSQLGATALLLVAALPWSCTPSAGPSRAATGEASSTPPAGSAGAITGHIASTAAPSALRDASPAARTASIDSALLDAGASAHVVLSASPPPNPVVEWLLGAEFQAETAGQRAKVRRAFADMAELAKTELRARRYANHQGKPGVWDVPHLLRRHFVSRDRRRGEPADFWDHVDSDEVRALARFILDTMSTSGPWVGVQGWLGLQVGNRWEYDFRTHTRDALADGTVESWSYSCSYEQTVKRARLAPVGTVVELERRKLSESAPVPESKQGFVPTMGRVVVVLGWDEPFYVARWGDDFRQAEQYTGVGVYQLRAPGAERSRVALPPADADTRYVLPLRPGTAWHSNITERDAGADFVSGPNCLAYASQVTVSAGTFRGCFQVSTPWTAANEDEWVCPGVGSVEHQILDSNGSAQFASLTTLTRFSPARASSK